MVAIYVQVHIFPPRPQNNTPIVVYLYSFAGQSLLTVTPNHQQIIRLDYDSQTIRSALPIHLSLVKAIRFDFFPFGEGVGSSGDLHRDCKLLDVKCLELRVDLWHVFVHHVVQFLKVSAERVTDKV